MVNDIDYYSVIFFRGYIQGLGRSVLSGGQYDQAMAILGKKVEAIGFGLYLDEINRISRQKQEFDIDTVLIYEEWEDVSDVINAVQELQRD